MRGLTTAIALVVSFSVSAGRCDEPQDADGTPSRPLVIQVRLEDEAITPITARFVGRAIRMADEQRAECLVIVLDTPGGLVDSTRQMVKDILRSEVPVVVHVAPPGGRAASAGVFVTMAAPIAAMAPGTNIGAAHPVAAAVRVFRWASRSANESVSRFAEGVGSRFRRRSFPCGSPLPENDSRPPPFRAPSRYFDTYFWPTFR